MSVSTETMADDSEGGRKLRAKERKKYIDQDIDEDDIDGKRMYSVEEKLLSDKFTADMVQELTGPEFTMEWMQKNGLARPIVFYDKTGLGLRVPSENFKVSDVKQCVGSRRILDVMDVNTQKAMEMSMKDWVKYYENPERDRLLNVISLEFCHTRLENYVESPTLVRQIDWVDRAWPRHLKECQTESTNVIEKMKYPKVQKYCLMSVAGCYTDFHIDFGGTSVWYHILHGEKIFWLAPPSPKNIDCYIEWTLSAKQGDSFLGDSLEQCQRIQLRAGYTFIIPSGWIHAVYTPIDSLVFGGNFLHSFNIENQLLVSRIEDKTYVPPKFRYPFFSEIMWYVADRYIHCLTGRTHLASCEKDELDEDDHGLIQVDEDSRPPSRNPDSRPPSRTMDDSCDSGKIKSESGEDPPKLSKSVTIELTRIDAAQSRMQSEEEGGMRPSGKPKLGRKAASDSSLGWDGGGGSLSSGGGGGNRKWVHLTTTELKGLKQLVDYLAGLMALPPSKRGVPREMLDPEAVLREIRQVLEDHKNDDQTLAWSGEPSIGWPESAKKKQQKLKLGYKTFKTVRTPKGSGASSSSIRRRRTRCKQCEACTRSECGECTFCKDMKKFGGPGRMKQTCISRQCMAPVLPSSSVCLICNQEGQESSQDPDDVSMQLMECGICWEIVHPACLQKKYENLDNDGAVNEDLPNSWECSKCCNEGKQGQLKPRVRPGIGSVKKFKSEDHRSSADSDGSQDDDVPLRISPVEGKRVVSKPEAGGGSRQPYIKTEPNGGGLEGKLQSPTDPKKISTLANAKVKLEPGGFAPGKEDGQRKRSPAGQAAPKDAQRKHIKKEQISAPSSPSQDEGSRGARKRPLAPVTVSGGGGNGKSSVPLQPESGTKRPKREGQVMIPEDGAECSPAKGCDDSHIFDEHLSPAKKARSSTMGRFPKQEAAMLPREGNAGFYDMDSSSSSFPYPSSTPTTLSRQMPLAANVSRSQPQGVTAPYSSTSSSSSSLTSGSSSSHSSSSSSSSSSQQQQQQQPPTSHNQCFPRDKDAAFSGGGQNGEDQTPGPSPEKLRWGVDYAPKVPLKNYVVRPAPPPMIPDFVTMENGSPHPLPHGLWMLVFRYLPQSELARLSSVCRTFDCWVLDPILWLEINLSLRSVKQTHLKFVMLRQPQSLKLASSVISYAQLSWLIARLPGLKLLDLSNLSWASICALCSSDCPLLKSLNLSWATGIRDLCFRELASPPVNLKPGQRNISRLCRLERLSLTGTDINDQSLEVIAAHLPKLAALDLTCCMRVTDRGIRALVQLGAPCHLREIRLVKCVQLTERCLESLASCRELSFLALTDIPAISQEACVRFSRNYRHRTLRAHAHGIISD
ncbi:lysine-specific demethylase 2A [Aplysia californica]|uniref:Lysine-specific demethylase 2A n=1 Tax=Aplysia californica TaxID=6500 RepID=A0ABM0JCB1_APLCA|nr:lysine-specific demethylase 2A [Aplysia californica]